MDKSDFLFRAYALSNDEEARALYDDWADTYDDYLEHEDYALPGRAVQALEQSITGNDSLTQAKILDAGCGTGLVGVALAQQGAKQIDGIDISPGMLAIARKSGVYRGLEEANLTKPIPRKDNTYDFVICVGTLTKGHVGPKVLDEFQRVVRKGGLIVASITDLVWESAGFAKKIDQLVDAGYVTMRRQEVVGISSTAASGARIVVLEKV